MQTQINKLNLVLDPAEPEVVMDRKTFLLLFDEQMQVPRIALSKKRDTIASIIRTAQSEEKLVTLLSFHLHKCKLEFIIRDAMEQSPDFFQEEWK